MWVQEYMYVCIKNVYILKRKFIKLLQKWSLDHYILPPTFSPTLYLSFPLTPYPTFIFSFFFLLSFFRLNN